MRPFSLFTVSSIINLLGLMAAVWFGFCLSFPILIPLSFLLVSFKVALPALFFALGIHNPPSPKEGFSFLYPCPLPLLTVSSGLFGLTSLLLLCISVLLFSKQSLSRWRAGTLKSSEWVKSWFHNPLAMSLWSSYLTFVCLILCIWNMEIMWLGLLCVLNKVKSIKMLDISILT